MDLRNELGAAAALVQEAVVGGVDQAEARVAQPAGDLEGVEGGSRPA